MKKLLMPLIGCIAFCCNPPAKEVPQMTGAYNQVSQTVKGGDIDTTTVSIQLKIFTPDYMMYATFDASDSSASFGIGDYSTAAGVVTENVIYSASDTAASTGTATYTLEIEKTPTGYTQVIREMGDSIKFQLTETYERINTEQNSALDGAWQLVSLVDIANGDTTKVEINQYKTYFAGNFIFGHTYRDSTNVLHTGMGYGTFEMANDSTSKEFVKVSTYKTLIGQSVDLAIKLNGPDEYTQTITNENGSMTKEVYKRMKK